MKKIMMLVVMVAAFVLPTMAQSFSQQDPNTIQFQSTSTLQTSGSTYSSNPTLNEDGTAYSPAASAPAGGPRRIGGLPGGGGGGGGSVDLPDTSKDSGNVPVGDAVLPLMLMAMAYAVYSVARVYRRKRRL